jgi:hypothetical protein
MTPLNPSLRSALLLGLFLPLGCGRNVTQTPTKLAGVGLNPEQIGPKPTDYGGLIEYDWVNLSGAALPLGLLGLIAYDSSGPETNDFQAPYSLIYGVGFLFENDLPAVDSLFGNWGTPPAVDGTCYTNFEPQAYISALVDVGTAIEFKPLEGDGGFKMGRRPLEYPVNVENVFPYYLELGVHRVAPRYAYQVTDPAGDLSSMEQKVISGPNFNFGVEHEITFPGGLPPMEASFGSVPVPLASAGEDTSFVLPTEPAGVMLSWEGPVYDPHGVMIATSGTHKTCLQYLAHSTAPESPEDCTSLETYPEPDPNDRATYPQGQIYTGPWSTSGGVTFSWVPSEAAVDEIVTIGIRFLGAVDEDDKYKVEGVIRRSPGGEAKDLWGRAQEEGDIPTSADTPEGRRPAGACEDDFEWVFDDALADSKGDYLPSLQGDPSKNLAQTTCRVADSAGTFTFTEEMLQDAIDYGRRAGAQGAVFYFARTTVKDLETPDVRDHYGQRRDTSAVRVVSNAVQLGRFWFDL